MDVPIAVVNTDVARPGDCQCSAVYSGSGKRNHRSKFEMLLDAAPLSFEWCFSQKSLLENSSQESAMPWKEEWLKTLSLENMVVERDRQQFSGSYFS